MCETKCLIFPKLDSKNIYTLIFVLASLCQKLIPKIIEKIEDNISENVKPPNRVIYFFDIISFFFCVILAGILILKNKFCLKEKSLNNVTTSVGQKSFQNMKKFFFLIMPLIALMNFLGKLCLYFFYCIFKDFNISEENLFFMIFFDILFRYIFSRIFLKSYFYKHHYFSMFLNIIGIIPLIIISINNIFVNNNSGLKEIVIYFLLYFIRIIISSLEDILSKIALNKLLLRPYQMMFCKALFEIIPLIVLTIPANIADYSYIKQIFENILNFLLYRIVYIICGFFLNYSYITIIELINPNHLSVLKSIEFIAIFFNYMVWSLVENNNVIYLNYLFEFISCLFILFGACIHNEMIIFKKCGFYECTDYYKTEIRGFSNIDIDFEADLTTNADKKEDHSLMDQSSFSSFGN